MKIAVVSDTHGAVERLKSLQSVFDTCDELFFLGDGENDIKAVRTLFKAQTVAVSGNNDHGSSFLKEAVEEIHGIKFFLTHGHLFGVNFGVKALCDRARQLGCGVVLYGHTHRAEVTAYEGITVMNPGSLGYPREARPSYGILEGDERGVFGKIVYI